MAKTKISEFSTNPANNTDINGINIAEGCAPSGINNAIRQLMSDLKEFQTGAAGDDLTVGGNLVVTGTTTLTGVPTAPTAAQGTSSTQIATTAFVQQNSAPTGGLMMWPTATAPSGWLLCNGQTVSRATYAALFALIGTTFGAGDGSTTFTLPDYRDRMPIGANTITAIAGTGGSKDAVLVSHTHTATSTVTDPGHFHISGAIQNTSAYGVVSVTGSGKTGDSQYNQSPITSTQTTGVTVSTTVASAGSPATNANLPPYLGINFIIKA